jgi:protoporphyrinogen oxidase
VSLEADHVWSTIPITVAARLMDPAPPPAVLDASRGIAYRAMLLVYLELGQDRFSEYDAHYFPGADVRITRLSEPKNYAARTEPAGRTVLCAELPCDVGDESWEAPDARLAALVAEDLRVSGLPLGSDPVAVRVERLPQAYPIYRSGYEDPFGVLDAWAGGLSGFLSFGRQGLFAHDNTHHALAMAYGAVSCFGDGGLRHEEWARLREVFATHVVED